MSFPQPVGTPAPAPRQTSFLPPSPMTIGNVFSTAWRLLTAKFGLLLGLMVVQVIAITAAITIPLLIGVFAVLGIIGFDENPNPTGGQVASMIAIGFVLLLVALAVAFWAQVKFSAMSIAALDQRARGQEATWSSADAATKGVARRALTVILISVGLVLAGYLLFGMVFGAGLFASDGEPSGWLIAGLLLFGLASMVLAIYVGTRFQYLNQILSVERLGGTDVFRRSWQLTKGRFWETFGRMLLGMLAPTVVLILLSIPNMNTTTDDPSTAFSGPAAIAGLLSFIGLILTSMWQVAYTTTMYIDQVRRHAAQGILPNAVAAQAGGFAPQGGFGPVATTQAPQVAPAPVDTWGQQPVGPLGSPVQQTPPAPSAPEQPQHFGIEPTREIPGEEPTQIPGEEPTRQTPGEGPTREIPTDPWARPKDAE